METVFALSPSADDLFFVAVTAVVAAVSSLLIFVIFFYWFRREQRRWQERILQTLVDSGRGAEERIITGPQPPVGGELVAKFKVNHGKQVVSVLESDGKRFIHVVGELSPEERTKMVRYLKSEGFMS